MRHKKMLCAVLGALGITLIWPGSPRATDLTVESGETLTTTQDIGSDSTVVVEDGGAIQISPLNFEVEAILGNDGNEVINYGTIAALDSGAAIHLANENSIFNYGIIETSAQASNISSGDAVDVHGNGNSIFNWGTIRVFDSMNGYGVHFSVGTGNVLINYGVIETTGGGSNAVHVESTSNTIINHGTITTAGTTGDGLYIVGGNTFINSGTLISANDDAIHMNGSGSKIYLLAGSAVYGGLDLHDSSDNSFDIGNGLNAILTFENRLPDGINTNGMPFVTDGMQLQLAVVDPTGFAMAEDLLADLTDQAFNAVSSRLRPRSQPIEIGLSSSLAISPAADVYHSDMVSGGIAAWARLIGTWREQSDTGITWSGQQRLTGLISGFDMSWASTARAGLFIGAARVELAVDDEAQEIDTDNVWGGVYLGDELGDYRFELAALAGWQTNDSTRRMVDNTVWGGVAYADASYEGVFVSPQASISRDWEFAGQPLKSTLALRYAGLFLEDYQEEGSNADLAVEARDIHSLTAKAELARPVGLPFALAGLRLEALGGAEARYTFGDKVSAVLLDESISFEPDDQTVTLSGFAGGELSFTALSGFLEVALAGKASVSSDNSVALALQFASTLQF